MILNHWLGFLNERGLAATWDRHGGAIPGYFRFDQPSTSAGDWRSRLPRSATSWRRRPPRRAMPLRTH